VINGLAAQAACMASEHGAAASQLCAALGVLRPSVGLAAKARPDGGLEPGMGSSDPQKVAPAQPAALVNEVGRMWGHLRAGVPLKPRQRH